ncbi:hydantoinase/oxoprolinase family protein [Caballeronia novacaledonica]|uniref:Hydantoinase/oxoprolinase family protein n=1 Tax=Caballeronia novacaledonica TaxID=1544861 RepID=A0ACB5QLH8_9BURK|nr:hydantoinase/oxoprolinase family protein [Caballeronia novacaledonica]GJH09982.1 hydantoinase/oxoprolinase family protein [Caballeronia novacaledonica]GJH16059.1 hydantoinase/oxoprolinase family protein [Caballeronia novacaledonica]
MGYEIGIDVGGTFTDFVVRNGGETFSGKTLTTPSDEATGILNAVAVMAEHFRTDVQTLFRETSSFVLGTTVVTNAILEYAGANTGMITTKGFRDIIELRTGFKEDHFDIRLPAPFPIVPRQKRKGVTERIDSEGKIVFHLDEAEVREAARELKKLGVESVAICFLFSFQNAVHEIRAREIVREELPDAHISISSEVLPQVREFERFSTTLLNAYLSPKLSNYLRRLEARLVESGFGGKLFIKLSNGGVMDLAYCTERGVELIQSGPSGGVTAAIAVGEWSGFKDIIAVDMGGTSYDVCLINDGAPDVGVDSWVNRYRVAAPMIDIHSIGTGGGSIAWIDEGGALRVGPRSASSNPGPACYGRGGKEPTVTDANLILGYLNPGAIGGGKIALDIEAAREAVRTRIAEPLGISVEEAASGIFRISNGAMTNAVRYVSVSRGRDPRDFALMAFGGAGPIHMGVQAKDLGIKTVLVPKNAGVFCALGCLISDFKISKVKSYISRIGQVDLDVLNGIFEDIEREPEALLASAHGVIEVVAQRSIDMRYVGQTHEVTVPIRSRTKRVSDLTLKKTLQDFHDLHAKLYSFKRPEQPVEILSVRSDLIGTRDTMKYRSQPFGSEKPDQARKGTRSASFEGLGYLDVPVYDGTKVTPGNIIAGPSIIEEPATTIVIYPGQEAVLDHYQTYVIESLD